MIVHWITDVQHTGGFRLRLRFENGRTRLVDLEPHLTGEVFGPLRDLERFRAARLNPDLDTVVWNNGADMSPDFLFDIGHEETGTPSQRVAEPPETYTARKPGT
jgi:hypothetical protein